MLRVRMGSRGLSIKLVGYCIVFMKVWDIMYGILPCIFICSILGNILCIGYVRSMVCYVQMVYIS